MMTFTIAFPAAVALLGALVYLLAGRGPDARPRSSDWKELGRITFFCGLYWLVCVVSGRVFAGKIF